MDIPTTSVGPCPYWNSPTFPVTTEQVGDWLVPTYLDTNYSEEQPEVDLYLQLGCETLDPDYESNGAIVFSIQALIDHGWLDISSNGKVLYLKKAPYQKKSYIKPIDGKLMSFPEKLFLLLNIVLSDEDDEEEITRILEFEGFTYDSCRGCWCMHQHKTLNLNTFNTFDQRGALALNVFCSSERVIFQITFKDELILQTTRYEEAQQVFNGMVKTHPLEVV
jgi:hypothetical protein